MAACDPPGRVLQVSVTCRCRLMRLTAEGPGARLDIDHLSRPTEPRFGRRHGHRTRGPSDWCGTALQRAHAHVVLILACIESGRYLPRDQRIQRLFDVEHRDAQVGGASAIDHQAHFGLAAAQSGIGIGHAGNPLHLCEQRVGVLSELVEIRALNVVLNFRIALIAADGRDQFNARVNLRRILLQEIAGHLHDVDLVHASLVDVGELDVYSGVVGGLIGRAAHRGQRVFHAGQSADVVRDAFGERCGGGERSAFGRAHQNVVLRLIVGRAESSCRRT